jgi:predicted nucleic acid-binding protein
MPQPFKKPSLYLETSFWNFIYADDAPEKRDATRRLFEEIKAGRYDIFVSEHVLAEIGRTRDLKKRTLLEDSVRELNPALLPASREVEALTAVYLRANFVSRNASADVAHIAYASAYQCDVIVSWNLRHIVRLKTKVAVNGINKQLGYREVEIVTPEEVIGYGA